ncbi:putative uncharacterized protein [Acetobacter sp. CAG:267]|nr:putative uncharacterized protein [Acetobacter sp. CAG:267]
MWLYTNELKISWSESITSQSNNRSFNPVLRLFFYFKGEKMDIEKIRRLNDTFRKTFYGGRVVLTRCVQSLPDDDRKELLKQVQAFDNFTEDNDPYGEHNFGAINFKNDTYFWKIDYYDTDYNYFSPDASDSDVTNRVITIMRGDEY